MKAVAEISLEGYGVRLDPLAPEQAGGLASAASDGNLWELWFTHVPAPEDVDAYIAAALEGRRNGTMLPWVVRDAQTGRVIGSTRYHDIDAGAGRVEIGYTWYARSAQGSHVNPACKLLLMTHAFEHLGCNVVGFRTDAFNFRSQRAIERLGANKDGVIRRYQLRRDGSLRDTVMYSVLPHEWPDVKRSLMLRLTATA